MSIRYKLLALDLDDTLLTKDKQISKKIGSGLIKRGKQGQPLYLRLDVGGMQRVEHLLDDLGLSGLMVLVNGAEVWAEKGKLLERHYIKKRYL